MADNKPAVLGGTAIKPVERVGWEKVRYLIHNPETGEYFTRTPKSWGLIIIFYIIYYSCLAAFWAAMLMIFFQTIPDDKPKWLNKDSIIGISPGLGMRPKQTEELIDSSIIQFNWNKKDDSDGIPGWNGWASRSKEFLNTFKGTGETCTAGSKPAKGKVCKFDIATLGECGNVQTNLGFDKGKPCIYLKLNKIYGLENDPLDPSDLPEDIPAALKKHIEAQADKNQVWVECHGQYPADKENLGEIKYYPAAQGFPSYYFPYEKQEGYETPVVAVQFNSPMKNMLLHVECRAWAKNIGYEKRDRVGINLFELHILDKDLTSVLADKPA